MAFHEFLAYVRAARSLLPPDVLTAGLAASPGHVQKALDSADIWLRPAFVEPFDPAMLPHPDHEVRDRLAQDVDVIRELAVRVGNDGVATPEQRREGLAALLRIIPAVRPFAFYPMTEELTDFLWGVLEPKYPGYVLGFECEFGQDWSGDPSVRVTATIPTEDVVETEAFDRFFRDIREVAREWVRDHSRVEYWPYPSLRTADDMRAELAGVER